MSNALNFTQKTVLAYSRTVSGTLSLISSFLILNKIYCICYGQPPPTRPDTAVPREYDDNYRPENSPPTDSISHSVSHNSTDEGGMRRSSTMPRSTTVYQRLLIGTSTLDIFHSFWAALSTLPVPASSGAVFGHGTTATCSVQGFFVQFSAATPLYFAAFTIYFLCKVRYHMTDEMISKKYERYFHFLPFLVAFGGAISGVSLKVFNPIALPELGCWVAPYPIGCYRTNTCTRGYKIAEYSDYYAWLFAFIWFFLSFIVVTINTTLIYCSIYQREERHPIYAARVQTHTVALSSLANSTTLRSQGDKPERNASQSQEEEGGPIDGVDEEDDFEEDVMPDDELDDAVNDQGESANRAVPRRRRSVRTSRIAAVQCLLYVSTALFTTVWSVMPWIGKKLYVKSQWRFFFAFMFNIFNPLQGFFTLIIFIRLQYLRLRVAEPSWSRLRCVRFCLFSPDAK
jgi:hypothetical protein